MFLTLYSDGEHDNVVSEFETYQEAHDEVMGWVANNIEPQDSHYEVVDDTDDMFETVFFYNIKSNG